MKPIVLPEAKHIIWDWNGTLVNDLHHTYASVVTACKHLGLEPPSVEHFRSVCRHPLIDFWRDIGFDDSKHELEVIAEKFIDTYEELCDGGLELHVEVPSILQGLQAQNTPCSLLSAHIQELVERRVDEFGIRQYFRDIHCCKRRDGHGKLAEAMLLRETIPVPLENILLIGDTTHDFEVAQALGVACALVSRGPESPERLQSLGIPVFSSLNELFPALKID